MGRVYDRRNFQATLILHLVSGLLVVFSTFIFDLMKDEPAFVTSNATVKHLVVAASRTETEDQDLDDMAEPDCPSVIFTFSFDQQETVEEPGSHFTSPLHPVRDAYLIHRQLLI